MRSVWRIIRWCLLTPLLIGLAICTAGEIQQRLLVHRAGSLLSDIHSLRLHESNWRDAQRLMTRWGKSGHYDGVCTPEDCFYVITLHNMTVPANNNVAEWPSRTIYFLSAFRLLPRQWGGGLRLIQAMFLVQNGIVVRSGVSIDMTPSPFAKGAQDTCCGAELIMSVRSQSSLGAPRGWQEEERSRHPDYTVWRPGGCTFCLMGRVTYADSIPFDEAAKLSDFQLSCATRWSSCLTLEELDPAAHAWHLYGPPWGDPPDETWQQTPVGCTLPLYALGRDANRILSVEALEDGVRLGTNADGVEQESSRVRVIAALKGESPWAIGSFHRIISSGSPFGDKLRQPDHLMKSKSYLLILGNEDAINPDQVSLESCGIVGGDAHNQHEIRRGMAMDDRLHGFEPTVSLEGFARHRTETWAH